jgi:hypothetical protein
VHARTGTPVAAAYIDVGYVRLRRVNDERIRQLRGDEADCWEALCSARGRLVTDRRSRAIDDVQEASSAYCRSVTQLALAIDESRHEHAVSVLEQVQRLLSRSRRMVPFAS